MNIITVLNNLLELELKMQRLYRHFEKLFVYDSAAIRLFHDLSSEEKSHADMIRYQLRIVRNNLNIFQDISFDAAPLMKLRSQVRAIITGDNPPTLKEAVLFSIKAERSASELHLKTAIAQSNPEMGEHIRSLGSYDEAHDRLLTAFAKTLGIYEEQQENTSARNGD